MEDEMSQLTRNLPASRSLLDIVERASLFEILQQAMQRQQKPQDLPNSLHVDLGLPPAQAVETPASRAAGF
jgi:hypothetical protein